MAPASRLAVNSPGERVCCDGRDASGRSPLAGEVLLCSAPDMNQIVVGVDDSTGARAALRWAIEQAKLSGAPVKAVHAYDFHVAWVDDPGIHIDEWRAQAEAQARARLEHVISDVTGGSQDVVVSPVTIEGAATPTLLDASTGADLLVVGSRGRGGFAGMLLGSVSQHCAEHAHCPVVVVPPPG